MACLGLFRLGFARLLHVPAFPGCCPALHQSCSAGLQLGLAGCVWPGFTRRCPALHHIAFDRAQLGLAGLPGFARLAPGLAPKVLSWVPAGFSWVCFARLHPALPGFWLGLAGFGWVAQLLPCLALKVLGEAWLGSAGLSLHLCLVSARLCTTNAWVKVWLGCSAVFAQLSLGHALCFNENLLPTDSRRKANQREMTIL